MGESRWCFNTYGVMTDVISSDDSGNLYVYCVAVIENDDGTILSKAEVRVYDRDSVLVSATAIDCSSFVARPEAPLFIQRRCAGILGTRL